MTITVAQRLQSCFTVFMPTRTRTNESIYDKAERILSEPNSVMTIESLRDDFWRGLVRGDHGVYEVIAASERVRRMLAPTVKGRLACTCPRGWRRKRCSHMIVGEEMRKRGEDA